MPLTLRMRIETALPIECPSFTDQFLWTAELKEIARSTAFWGRERAPCGDLFDISGSAQSDRTIHWEGDCRSLHGLATGFSGGTVRVAGSVGRHAGARMTGGELIVEGDAGDWLGAEMRGGRIHVEGGAGDHVGGAYAGGKRGQAGGEILIRGDVGHHAGEAMRRGLLVVQGNVGDAAGARMIAGSLVVGGRPGRFPGWGMKRGTVIFLQPGLQPELLPTFQVAGVDQPQILRVLHRYLRERGVSVAADCDDAFWTRFRGDLQERGQGEIFIRSEP